MEADQFAQSHCSLPEFCACSTPWATSLNRSKNHARRYSGASNQLADVPQRYHRACGLDRVCQQCSVDTGLPSKRRRGIVPGICPEGHVVQGSTDDWRRNVRNRARVVVRRKKPFPLVRNTACCDSYSSEQRGPRKVTFAGPRFIFIYFFPYFKP